jgi:hypothetical protein
MSLRWLRNLPSARTSTWGYIFSFGLNKFYHSRPGSLLSSYEALSMRWSNRLPFWQPHGKLICGIHGFMDQQNRRVPKQFNKIVPNGLQLSSLEPCIRAKLCHSIRRTRILSSERTEANFHFRYLRYLPNLKKLWTIYIVAMLKQRTPETELLVRRDQVQMLTTAAITIEQLLRYVLRIPFAFGTGDSNIPRALSSVYLRDWRY